MVNFVETARPRFCGPQLSLSDPSVQTGLYLHMPGCAETKPIHADSITAPHSPMDNISLAGERLLNLAPFSEDAELVPLVFPIYRIQHVTPFQKQVQQELVCNVVTEQKQLTAFRLSLKGTRKSLLP
jgi:hypothetical protein